MKDNAIKTTKGSNAVANQVTQKKSAGKSMPSATVQMQEEEKDQQMKADVVQRQAEEEEKMQMKADIVQRQGEEEEKMQMKADVVQRQGEEEEKMQMKADVVQRESAEDDELKQAKFDTVQRQEAPAATSGAANNTGMPDSMKSSMESMSGMDLSDVKVHKNSEKPKSMGALAYAQGTDIHVAPGQEQHLGHEAWHVVQQKQGRVKPTIQLKGGVPVNDDSALEEEADVMGARAAQAKKK